MWCQKEEPKFLRWWSPCVDVQARQTQPKHCTLLVIPSSTLEILAPGHILTAKHGQAILRVVQAMAAFKSTILVKIDHQDFAIDLSTVSLKWRFLWKTRIIMFLKFYFGVDTRSIISGAIWGAITNCIFAIEEQFWELIRGEFCKRRSWSYLCIRHDSSRQASKRVGIFGGEERLV